MLFGLVTRSSSSMNLCLNTGLFTQPNDSAHRIVSSKIYDMYCTALLLHLNCTALSQSELSNFFMYIIITNDISLFICLISRYQQFKLFVWICLTLKLQQRKQRALVIYISLLTMQELQYWVHSKKSSLRILTSINSFVIIFEHYVTKQDIFSSVARIFNPQSSNLL